MRRADSRPTTSRRVDRAQCQLSAGDPTSSAGATRTCWTVGRCLLFRDATFDQIELRPFSCWVLGLMLSPGSAGNFSHMFLYRMDALRVVVAPPPTLWLSCICGGGHVRTDGTEWG